MRGALGRPDLSLTPHRVAIRWIFQSAFPITGFVLRGEHAMLEVEREYALKRSYVKVGRSFLQFRVIGHCSFGADPVGWVPGAEMAR